MRVGSSFFLLPQIISFFSSSREDMLSVNYRGVVNGLLYRVDIFRVEEKRNRSLKFFSGCSLF